LAHLQVAILVMSNVLTDTMSAVQSFYGHCTDQTVLASTPS